MKRQIFTSSPVVDSHIIDFIDANDRTGAGNQERSKRKIKEGLLGMKGRDTARLDEGISNTTEGSYNNCEQTLVELLAAQKIAGLGTMTSNLSNETTTFSEGVYSLLALDPDTEVLDLSRIIAMVHDDDRQRVVDFLREGTDQDHLAPQICTEFRFCRADGQQRWIEARSELTTDSSGEKIIRLATLQDVSERKVEYEKLRVSEALASEKVTELEALQSGFLESRDKAEKASRSKSRFLAVMSHEIRTPLNGVLGSLQILSDAGLKAPQQKLIEIAMSSANGLCRLTDDVIELSRLETGRLELELTPFNVIELLKQVCDFWSPAAEGKGLILDYSVDRRVPQLVLGDPARIRQVLDNYMSNAVKFTDRGGVTLRLGVDEGRYSSKPNEVRVRFEVKDTGIGIAQSDHRQLFQDFTQLPESVNSQRGGAGLGLAICQGLCRRMGGIVGVSSEIDIGSTFWMTVPFQRASVAVGSCEEARKSGGLMPLLNIAGNSPRILLVEDVKTNQIIAEAFLRGFGCDVDIAGNGVEAIKAIEERRYDVVLMDITMPVMDGVEATSRIRATKGWQGQLPILGLTAYAHEEEIKAFLAAGMNEVIHKPLNKSELHEALSNALAPGELKNESAQSITQPTAYLERAILDELRESLPVDKMENLLERVMTDIRSNHTEAITGAKRGDIDCVGRACHMLKGMGGSFGSPELSRLAEEIEQARRNGDQEKVMVMVLSDLDLVCTNLMAALEKYKETIPSSPA
ncbi:MAG: response regulator [Halieaceae bacterium]